MHHLSLLKDSFKLTSKQYVDHFAPAISSCLANEVVVDLRMTPALAASVGSCQADPEDHDSEWGSSWWSEESTEVSRDGGDERRRRMTLSGVEGMGSSSAEESNLPPG